MKTSALAPNPNMLRTSGQNIPEALRRFNFRLSEYRTLYAASGFMDPPLLVGHKRPHGPKKGVSFSLCSQGCPEKDCFHPVEVIFNMDRDRNISSDFRRISIFTDPYCGMLGQGSYPGSIRTLIEDVWKGDLLPAGRFQHRVSFNDGGVSVVFRDDMRKLVGSPLGLNHVVVLVGEKTSFYAQPRFAAKMIYSHITLADIMSSSAAGALFSLAMNISADNAAK